VQASIVNLFLFLVNIRVGQTCTSVFIPVVITQCAPCCPAVKEKNTGKKRPSGCCFPVFY
jgi:hypothetical protein